MKKLIKTIFETIIAAGIILFGFSVAFCGIILLWLFCVVTGRWEKIK